MKTPSIKLVPQLDRSPTCVAFAQTVPGKLCIVAVFAGLAFLHGIDFWWLISLYLVAFSLWPRYRWQILLPATWLFLLVGPARFDWKDINTLFLESGIAWQINTVFDQLPLLLAVVLFTLLCLWMAQSSSLEVLIKRPVLTLLLLYLGLMMCLSYLPLPAAFSALAWAFLAVLGKYLWFLCYSIKELRSPNRLPIHLQFGHFLPFWSPNPLPYPKGTGYLRKIEAKTATELAICQLKGLKLLLWALWLKLFTVAAHTVVFGYGELFFSRLQFKREANIIQFYLDGVFLKELLPLPFSEVLPHYATALQIAASGAPLPWYTNWAVLMSDFLYYMLTIAFTGHIIIATVRMCGFNALRNTYRPLASKSIAEFWNRFFYYYKELLVEFFFYPTFFRYFKNLPMLRMYFATMAAACLGNFLFHYLRDIWFIVELGFFQSLIAFHTFFVYCFILGNGIFLSQWLQKKRGSRQPGRLSHFFAPVRVLGFFCLIYIFGTDYNRGHISDNIAFLLSLSPF
jgi:hypothetical protein